MATGNSVDPRKLIAEMGGTFALIFIGVSSVIAFGDDIVAVALAHGLAIALLVSSIGHVSGGLFNPAFTLGLWVTQRLDTINTVLYIAAQLVGSVLGALALVVLYPETLRDLADLGTPTLNGVTHVQGLGIEGILTVFLMLAVFGTCLLYTSPSPRD